MTKEEKIAQERYDNGEAPKISTFIDEDTIIMGYGNLDYDFEFPLPMETIRKIHGTTSWSKLLKRKEVEEARLQELEEVKDLAYYKTNAEEDYLQVPISVLRYISQLEQAFEKFKNK